ncbi:DUF3008 family protein [Thioclava sp. GXIMD4216]|uniref:DUF3008 family protein n=1 Tax=Thioclava litoralis TaxID=3076557 RepID=A0ABZ1DYZ6_9RHOB|nr:DUF3008 family protein [Thioclava sp. FTW29]
MEKLSVSHARAASAALAARRGQRQVHDLRGISRDMYDQLTLGELEEMAQSVSVRGMSDI